MITTPAHYKINPKADRPGLKFTPGFFFLVSFFTYRIDAAATRNDIELEL